MIRILAVGKIKEKFLQDGIEEYLKRCQTWQKTIIQEVKEYNQKSIQQNIIDEANEILKAIADKDYVITLEIQGKMLNSIELSQKIT